MAHAASTFIARRAIASGVARRGSRSSIAVRRLASTAASSSASSSSSTSSTTARTASQPTAGTQSGQSSASASLANTVAAASPSAPSRPSASEEATGSSTAADTSGLQASILGGIANAMGYNQNTSIAIRATSDYYDRCSERDEREASFFYEECGLPQSYTSWMQITNLHVWLLSVRFRSLPAPLGKSYIQEMINHYFIHSEGLMRGRYGVKQGRLIKGYMRDQLYQYHGANMGYDEGLISGSDAVLAAAVWRNIFGAGWGRVGGITGKLSQDGIPPESAAGVSASAPTPADAAASAPATGGGADSAAATAQMKEESPLTKYNLDPSLPPSPELPNQLGGYHAGGSGLVDPLPPHTPASLDGIQSKDARFAVNLERLVTFIRREVHRMEKLDDEVVMRGVLEQAQGANTKGLTAFSRI